MLEKINVRELSDGERKRLVKHSRSKYSKVADAVVFKLENNPQAEIAIEIPERHSSSGFLMGRFARGVGRRIRSCYDLDVVMRKKFDTKKGTLVYTFMLRVK